MSRRWVDDAKPWFLQAASDARTAEALHHVPPPMVEADVVCHVAAMCAQAIEKSLKGYVFLNGATPAMDHRPDGYLVALLRGDPLLQYEDHRGKLSRLFDAATRDSVTKLLDLTPGGAGNRTDMPNTEYPWTESDRWRFAPSVHPLADGETIKTWLDAAKRVSGTLHKLWVAVDRATAI
jgi:hypothetical protein